MQTVICFLFIFFIIGILSLIFYSSSKKNSRSMFLLFNRFKRIDRAKAFKWYLGIQLFCAFCKINNPHLDWATVFLIPISFMGLIFINSFMSVQQSPGESAIYETNEFKEFDKAFQRDKKLDKILK